MKRLPTATSFSLVLMFIGTSIAFVDSDRASSVEMGHQSTPVARNSTAGFTKSWTDKCSKKF